MVIIVLEWLILASIAGAFTFNVMADRRTAQRIDLLADRLARLEADASDGVLEVLEGLGRTSVVPPPYAVTPDTVGGYLADPEDDDQ